MKMRQKIHLTLLFLFISMQASLAQVLDKKVTMQFQNISLEQALKKIKSSYGVNFSYSPDQVDLSKHVSFQVRNESLGQVLNQLFRSTPITYRAVGNQIVLKSGKSVPKHTAGTRPLQPPVIQTKDSLENTTVNKTDTLNQYVIPVKPLEVAAKDSTQAIKELDNSYSKGLIDLNSIYGQKKDSVAVQSYLNKTQLKQSWKAAKMELEREYKQLRDSIMFAKKYKEADSSTIKYDEDLLIQDDFQFTGIYPLGSHLLTSGLYRNKYSLNLIGGYNGAVSKLEFGIVGNIIRREVQGVQFAGVANIVGEYVRGCQFAGVANITSQEVIGGQFAGIVNVANGAMYGVQGSGVVNVGTEQLDGVQVAGLVNQHSGTVNGGQIGLVNNAHKVNGFQFGLINICDSMHGIPFGLLSICKNGYGRIEAYYSETTRANVLIKSGVKSLYNIFQFGINFNSSYYRWTLGYGLGSTVQMSKNATISFDAILMHINENQAFTDNLNEEIQFRIMLGLNITKRVSIFAGPSINTSFSKYKNPDGTLGSKMIPKKGIIYDHTINGKDGLSIYNPYWLGFNVGLRF
ncbi:conserved hypothetical protein [Cytophaga hutchinsonii ATCC 33406]|uniref:Secretin/TonB short N-terminal domain-containing protein n=2 Tax=Cytophaga hutchinsonii TaxID=985 RepID=A0A6N4SW73_CYTH3|nr:conserved hypothetical protein [Cytophaga hutchinsonii ATCC 33406]SFX72175.1 Secretin and TonB N terminus short domain-containing protein [Cytophaga hutchinsonii ATCC 33406]